LFLVHQLWSGHAHQFDTDAHETHILDVWSDIGTGPRKTNPCAIRVGLRENAVAQLRREIIMNDKLAAHNAMRFGVATSFEPARLPEPAHLFFKARYDRVEVWLFVR